MKFREVLFVISKYQKFVMIAEINCLLIFVEQNSLSWTEDIKTAAWVVVVGVTDSDRRIVKNGRGKHVEKFETLLFFEEHGSLLGCSEGDACNWQILLKWGSGKYFEVLFLFSFLFLKFKLWWNIICS